MISGEPTRAIFRYVFWVKMVLILVAVALTVIMLAGLRAGGASQGVGRPAPVAYRALAVLVLLIWVAVIVTGRWIGYAQGWPGSPQ
jgi:hypothetical protein